MHMWLYSLLIRRHDLLSITLYSGMIRAAPHQPFQKQQFIFENMIRARVRVGRVSVDTLFLRNMYFENQRQHDCDFFFHNYDDRSCYAANKQADVAVRFFFLTYGSRRCGVWLILMCRKHVTMICSTHLPRSSVQWLYSSIACVRSG